MALHRGFFEDVGLDVWAGSPLEPNRPASYVAKGTDDFGLLQLPQLAIAREKGMPLVAVGSVVPQPTATMIWLKGSGISGIADLEGKTVAIPGAPFQRRLLEAVLTRAGLEPADVEVKEVGYNLVGVLRQGKADAAFGGSEGIEGVKLESLGAEPVITSPKKLGLPEYDELVVVTRSDLAAAEPQLVRDFMSAVNRGTAAAIKDPGGAVDAVVEGLEANPPPNRSVMESQMRATLPLLSRSGDLDRERIEGLIAWMHQEGLIARKVPAETLLAAGS
jgi:putative hydroxymethylpyrimidine transport system substrate-binding protein